MSIFVCVFLCFFLHELATFQSVALLLSSQFDLFHVAASIKINLLKY